MKSYKAVLKGIWILVLILALETMSVPPVSVNSLALGVDTKSVIAYNSSSDEKVAYSPQDLDNILKLYIEQRRTSFSIRYKADTTNLKSTIQTSLEGILETDDYLEVSTKSYEWNYGGYKNDVTVNFEFSFHTTKAQEDYVDSEVTAILKDIIKVSMNDQQKEKAIHDYIVANVAYDTTLKNYSAYEGLKNGLTVCTGYAQLAYKMLNESGIETKIVVGTGNGEEHAWNLVKLDNIWYHLDATWDDPIPNVKGRVLYNYFNLSDEEMLRDHSFEKLNYPAANTPYNYKTLAFDDKEFVKWNKSASLVKVSSTKEWNVNFDKEVDESSLRDKVFIAKQGTNVSFPLVLQLSENRKNVKIKHNIPFEPGVSYTLYISKDIRDVDEDAALKTSIKLEFTIVK
jgi:hypothetical protein